MTELLMITGLFGVFGWACYAAGFARGREIAYSECVDVIVDAEEAARRVG